MLYVGWLCAERRSALTSSHATAAILNVVVVSASLPRRAAEYLFAKTITGTRNGIAITGLTGYAGDDNLVYNPAPFLDYPGLAFTDANGFAYNVFYDTNTTDPYNCGFVGYCEIGPGTPGTSGLGPPRDPVSSIDFTLTQVPEPGSLALLGTSVLGLAGFVGRRVKF